MVGSSPRGAWMAPYASGIWGRRSKASHPPGLVPAATERVPSALRRVANPRTPQLRFPADSGQAATGEMSGVAQLVELLLGGAEVADASAVTSTLRRVDQRPKAGWSSGSR